MMTEETLKDLAAFIETTATEKDKERFSEALRDLQTTITSQALLTRNLVMQLRNKQVGSQALNAVLDANTLADSMSKLGTPTKNSFTVADVEAACNKLSNDVAQANDFKNILGAVVGIVKAFI